jgi:hypothetical protein
MKKPKI